VALIANCLLKIRTPRYRGRHYRGLVGPVVQALRSRGYVLQQTACPELALRRRAPDGGRLMSNTDTPSIEPTAPLAQAISPLIEGYVRRCDEVILIGSMAAPSGVRFTSSKPDWASPQPSRG